MQFFYAADTDILAYQHTVVIQTVGSHLCTSEGLVHSTSDVDEPVFWPTVIVAAL